MSVNLLGDPSFETGAGWSLLTDCNVNGASFNTVLGNVRTGARSLRINSRLNPIGPTSTCGYAEQAVMLVPGRRYVLGCWWKSAGVSPSVTAQVFLANVIGSANIVGNSLNWLLAVTAIQAVVANDIFRILQTAGTLNILQTRYYDDAFLFEAESPEGAALLSLSAKGGPSMSLAPTARPTAIDRLSYIPSSLAPRGVPSSLSLRATVQKKTS